MPDETPDPIAKLIATAKALSTTVADLSDKVDQQNRRIKINKGHIRTVAAVVVFDLVLTVVVGWAIHRQEVLSSYVLCPLYSVFLGSYAPNSRAPGDDRRHYEDAFAVLRDGYKVLGCDNPIVPPRSDQPK